MAAPKVRTCIDLTSSKYPVKVKKGKWANYCIEIGDEPDHKLYLTLEQNRALREALYQAEMAKEQAT